MHHFRQHLLVLCVLEVGKEERERRRRRKEKVEGAAARRIQAWWRQIR